MTANNQLPINETLAPEDQTAVADAVRAAHEARTPLYPIGGGTSLGFGAPPERAGKALSLARLNRVIDYPARDMTITVEAGVTMAELARTLAAEGQRLPIDAPLVERATLGGVVATNWSGPRRYGLGTIRDYVIGVSAVDGRGAPFKGGGRVVKNVAGYDFCKLLTGTLGTLGVITQLTFKVKPLPERAALVACDVARFEWAEPLLTALVTSQTAPAAIELLSGPAWRDDPLLAPREDAAATLVVGLEGTAPEVDWMVERLQAEWREQGVAESREALDDEAARTWRRLVEFPAQDGSPLVVKACLPPRQMVLFCKFAQRLAPDVSLQAHAGSGVVVARFAAAPDDLECWLSRQFRPQVEKRGGTAVVLDYRGVGPLTRRAIWGPPPAALAVMEAVKQQFDPRNILNPGRFVYGKYGEREASAS